MREQECATSGENPDCSKGTERREPFGEKERGRLGLIFIRRAEVKSVSIDHINGGGGGLPESGETPDRGRTLIQREKVLI